MDTQDTFSKKIHHHTRKAVRSVRAKPYHVRMQLVRIGTVIGGVCIVLLWISLLKKQLQIDPVVKKQEVQKKAVISEGILKVYDKAKNVTNK